MIDKKNSLDTALEDFLNILRHGIIKGRIKYHNGGYQYLVNLSQRYDFKYFKEHFLDFCSENWRKIIENNPDLKKSKIKKLLFDDWLKYLDENKPYELINLLYHRNQKIITYQENDIKKVCKELKKLTFEEILLFPKVNKVYGGLRKPIKNMTVVVWIEVYKALNKGFSKNKIMRGFGKDSLNNFKNIFNGFDLYLDNYSYCTSKVSFECEVKEILKEKMMNKEEIKKSDFINLCLNNLKSNLNNKELEKVYKKSVELNKEKKKDTGLYDSKYNYKFFKDIYDDLKKRVKDIDYDFVNSKLELIKNQEVFDFYVNMYRDSSIDYLELNKGELENKEIYDLSEKIAKAVNNRFNTKIRKINTEAEVFFPFRTKVFNGKIEYRDTWKEYPKHYEEWNKIMKESKEKVISGEKILNIILDKFKKESVDLYKMMKNKFAKKVKGEKLKNLDIELKRQLEKISNTEMTIGIYCPYKVVKKKPLKVQKSIEK